MTELLIIMGKIALGFACILGPIALLLAGQNIRDRREAKLVTGVLQGLNAPDLRGLFSVAVRTRPLGADTVVVSLDSCSREQAWSILERLSTQLPPSVKVEVNGLSDCRTRSGWRLTASGSGPVVAYCRQGC